jgi:phenylalanyl-tRNA synthetase beta chain
MKVSELWLREWVNPSLTGTELAAQLTMAGLEVDGFEPVAGAFNRVVVAKVLRTKPHPQADKLTLCDVDAGTGTLVNVVCGAANVRAGLTVALALPGANLPNGLSIKESVIRGEPSEGMLCSGAELGLEDNSEGIMELADDAPRGTDLREYLKLDDHVFDIDLTPNRADCFSVLGVAREVAALNKLPLSAFPVGVNAPTIDELLAIQLHAPDACPQYCGRIIRAINPDAVTPLWMKERLRRSGVRSLHPVVDVINYVMFELGQPMHAFDLQTIDGGIHVRYAQEQETLVLLDGQEVTLNENVLVIADNIKPLAIAGIMGGEPSSVQAHTTDIFLESAFFNPLMVAGVARRYGLSSDSSQRFERGVDPTLQIKALERATELLLDIVGGQVGTVITINKTDRLPVKVSIVFKPSQVKQLTGIDVPEADMMVILNDLGMTVTPQQGCWSVDVPAHRFDITLDVDLVEEITRLYGYDNIKAEPLIAAVQAGHTNPYEQLSSQLAVFLSNKGYHETISYSFVDPELQLELYPEAKAMQLLNPISSELSQMRVGMWPGLIASMVYNAHRQQTAIKFFEAGVVFDVNDGVLQERHCLAGLLTGEHGQFNWSESARTYDFYDMKGDLQSLFTMLGRCDVQYVAASHPALHPGQTARILVDGMEAGWLGVLHPRLCEALDLSNEVILFELSLKPLFHNNLVLYKQISKYPLIRRDLSLLVSNEVTAAQIEHAVREVVKSSLLKSFDVFDVYTGESIPVGKKSLAIGLTLQDEHRTLVDSEINIIISAIIKVLEDNFSIILRD